MDGRAPRFRLPRIDTSFTTFRRTPPVQVRYQPPTPQTPQLLEARLLGAVAAVLSVPVAQVQLFDSFTDLGGDVRSARTLVRACRARGIRLEAEDALRCRTLAELMTCVRACEPEFVDDPEEEDDDRDDAESSEDADSPVELFDFSPAPAIPPRNHPHSNSGGSRPTTATSTSPSTFDISDDVRQRLCNEAELHLLLHASVSRAGAVFITRGPFAGRVVAFVSLASRPGGESRDGSGVRLVRTGDQETLAKTLVPALREAVRKGTMYESSDLDKLLYVVLEAMPLSAEAALDGMETPDRESLRAWAERADGEMYLRVMAMNGGERKDRTASQRSSVHHARRDSKAQPSGRNSAHPSADQDAQGRDDDELYELAPMQMLYFASSMASHHSQPSGEAQQDGSHRFNQSLLLRLTKPTSVDDVRAAVEAVVGHHAMLRARFVRPPSADGSWAQRILPHASGAYGFGHHTVHRNEDVYAIVGAAQRSIDIENGPVFAAYHLRPDEDPSGSHDMLFLVAHRLVVDLASWRVVVHDLDELISSGCLLSGNRATPFYKWGRLLAAECRKRSLELDQRQRQQQKSNLFASCPAAVTDFVYWGLRDDDDMANTHGAVLTAEFSMSAELTCLLQTTCNAVFGTESADVYVAALLLSFAQTFPDHPASFSAGSGSSSLVALSSSRVPLVWIQEHGRSAAMAAGLKLLSDVENTVGWFTSLTPVGVPSGVLDGASDLLDVLRRVKDARRLAPAYASGDRGLIDFASRFYQQQEGSAVFSPAEWPLSIVFHDAGSLPQQLDREGGVLEQLALPPTPRAAGSGADATADVGPSVGRLALFEVQAQVDGLGRATVRFVWPSGCAGHRQAQIRAWIAAFEHLLLEAVGRLRYLPGELTLADVSVFGGADAAQRVGYDGLARLHSRETKARLGLPETASLRTEVEAVGPVTEAQQTLLMAAALDRRRGKGDGLRPLRVVYTLTPRDSRDVNVARLATAWQQSVVARRRMLRTVLVPAVASSSALYEAVVLRRVCRLAVLLVDLGRSQQPEDALKRLPDLPGDIQPRHRLAVLHNHSGESSTVYLVLDIDPTLCDASGAAVLLRDLARAYLAASSADSRPAKTAVIPRRTVGRLLTSARGVAGRTSTRQPRRHRSIQPSDIAFWRDTLAGVAPCILPSLTRKGVPVHVSVNAAPSLVPCLDEYCATHTVTHHAVLRLAWSLVLQAYTGAADRSQLSVCFGVEARCEEGCCGDAVGRGADLLPLAINIPSRTSIRDALRAVENAEDAALPHSHVGLARIEHELADTAAVAGRLCNTVLSLRDDRAAGVDGLVLRCLSERTGDPRWDVAIHVRLDDDGLTLEIVSGIVSEAQARSLAATIEHAVGAIAGADATSSLDEVDLFSDNDLANLLFWTSCDDGHVTNTTTNPPQTIPALLRAELQTRPDAPAIASWDGDLSHWALDATVMKLACHLVTAHSLQPGQPVPVVCTPGAWAVVAMLGVLRAGAVVVPFDTSVDDVDVVCGAASAMGAKLVVLAASPRQAPPYERDVLARCGARVVVVSEAALDALPAVKGRRRDLPLPDVGSEDVAFMLLDRETDETDSSFLGRSVHRPSSPGGSIRGRSYTHGQLARLLPSLALALGIDASTRAMQLQPFSSPHTSGDGSSGLSIGFVADLLMTLTAGGCACIPSSAERSHGFLGGVRRMGVTWARMPRLLARKVLPLLLQNQDQKGGMTLRTICFDLDGPCASLPAEIDALLSLDVYGQPRILFTYGDIAATEIRPRSGERAIIGRPVAGNMWVAVPQSESGRRDVRLLPVGALGELIIDGPAVPTAWTADGGATTFTGPLRTSRLPAALAGTSESVPVHRTGHMVRHVDGSGRLALVSTTSGNGSSQHTSRTAAALSHVESQMRLALGSGLDVAVDLVRPADADDQLRPALVAAFIELGHVLFDGGSDDGDLLMHVSQRTRDRLAIARRLAMHILRNDTGGSHSGRDMLLPQAFIPVMHIPATPWLTVDRRLLRGLVAGLSREQLLAFDGSQQPSEDMPVSRSRRLTPDEARLANVWADVLGIDDPSSIMPARGFVAAGGGSAYIAGRCAVACRAAGIAIDVADLMADVPLSHIVGGCNRQGGTYLECRDDEKAHRHNVLSQLSGLPTPPHTPPMRASAAASTTSAISSCT